MAVPSAHDSHLWSQAVSATLHCLTGCAIGEVLGLVLATWWGWSTVPGIVLAVVLAFVFGYGLTTSSVLRAGLGWRRALSPPLAAPPPPLTTLGTGGNP